MKIHQLVVRGAAKKLADHAHHVEVADLAFADDVVLVANDTLLEQELNRRRDVSAVDVKSRAGLRLLGVGVNEDFSPLSVRRITIGMNFSGC